MRPGRSFLLNRREVLKMIKNKTSVSYNRYNDGVAALHSVTGETTSFGAAKNVRALSDMEYICTVPFALQSCRVEDFDFAEENGFQLSRKVRMPLVSGIDNRKKAVINGLLYDISYIDYTRTEMYLYLGGERAIDT